MGRNRTHRRIDGWLIVDKPVGITSAAVVGKVRYLTDAAKVGHAGTLDPLATGVLPLALGEATKTVPYVMDGSKVYRFTVRWGESRTTDDADGDTVAISDVRPAATAIRSALAAFTGDIEQVPAGLLGDQGQRPAGLCPGPCVPSRSPWRHAPSASTGSTLSMCRTRITQPSRSLPERAPTCAACAATWPATWARWVISSPSDESPLGRSMKKMRFPWIIWRPWGIFRGLRSVCCPSRTALDDIPVLALTAVEARRLQRGQPNRGLARGESFAPSPCLAQCRLLCQGRWPRGRFGADRRGRDSSGAHPEPLVTESAMSITADRKGEVIKNTAGPRGTPGPRRSRLQSLRNGFAT